MVRVVGLEPTSLAALEPKGDVTSVIDVFMGAAAQQLHLC